MILQKILQLLKSPIFLVGLSVVSVVVIYVVVTRSPKTVTVTLGPKCPSGSNQITCSDGTQECAKYCPVGQQWDCGSKKCICSGNNKLCEKNTQCCNPCDNDICCSSSNQIKVNGVVSCCPPGTVPSKSSSSSTVNDVCVVACGNSTCLEGEQCIKLTNLNQLTYNNLVQSKGSEITSKDPTTNSLTFCSPMSTCSFGDEQPLPESQDSAYLYYNFDGISQQNKFSACLPIDSTSTDTTCFSNTTQDSCNNASSCKFVTLPDDYDPVRNKQFQSYMKYKNGSEYGYYCDPGGLSLGRIVQYKGTSGNCTWQDCLKQINSSGIIDTVWNDATQTCNAFKVPPYENIGTQPTQQIQCTGNNTNDPPCCKNKGDFVTAIKCTGVNVPCNNCKQAGDYICIQDGSECQPVNDGDWVFNTCTQNDSTGNAVRVLGPNGGNCPWGCSSKSEGTNCYSSDIPTGSHNIFGQPLSPSQEIVCLGNGQIVPQPTNPPITYFYDKSKFVCSQGSSSNPADPIYNTLCQCVNDIYNGNRTVSLNDISGNFLIYQKTTDGTRWYMYYDPSRRWFEYTSDINNDKLKQYNQTFPGNLNFNNDLSGTLYLNGYPFGVGFSDQKFQFCAARTDSPSSSTDVIGWGNNYSSALLKNIDNNRKSLNYNTQYQFTYEDGAYGSDPTNDINNNWENQTMTEEGSYSGLPNLTPEKGNYVYLTYYAIENQKAKQC